MAAHRVGVVYGSPGRHPLEAVRPGGRDRGERLPRHLQVTAGREGAVAGAGDDHDASLVVRAGLLEGCGEFGVGSDPQGVPAVRSADGDRRHPGRDRVVQVGVPH
jgi:hypothetical protein